MFCIKHFFEICAFLQLFQFNISVGFQYKFPTVPYKSETSHSRTTGSIGGKTYTADITLRSWNASLKFCERRGFDLATIATQAEARYLQSITHVYGWYWVAAKDLDGDGLFSWVKTGKTVSVLYTGSWWHHEPNEQCLVYDVPSKFFKRACYHGHYTLCESTQPINAAIPDLKLGRINLGSLDGKTYFGDGIPRTWRESQNFCLMNGMELATIRNRNQVDYLKSKCQQIKYDGWYWVKEMKLDDDSKFETWHKDDRCPCFNLYDEHYYMHNCNHVHFTLCEMLTTTAGTVHSSYATTIVSTNLTTPQVNIDGTTTTPGSLLRKNLLNQSLTDTSTERKQDKQDNSDSSLPKKSLEVYSSMLGITDQKLFYADSTLRNWTNALTFCKSIGMQLATITSQNQVDFLESAFNDVKFNGLYWIGGKYNNGDGNFKWVTNGEAVHTFDTLGWEGLENEDEIDLQCLGYSSDDNESWNYFKGKCDKQLYSLCEMSTSIRSNLNLGLTILITVVITVIVLLLIWKGGNWLHIRYRANRKNDLYIPVFTNSQSVSQTTL
ncbi:unnamed protein product [Orchesella dallaii]|uniref:C-type lectin domain-containing protein n=1 Tax=Orchesella dallaii TaxID=48710 RepID=A0ABP1QFL6_9HEXA